MTELKERPMIAHADSRGVVIINGDEALPAAQLPEGGEHDLVMNTGHLLSDVYLEFEEPSERPGNSKGHEHYGGSHGSRGIISKHKK